MGVTSVSYHTLLSESPGKTVTIFKPLFFPFFPTGKIPVTVTAGRSKCFHVFRMWCKNNILSWFLVPNPVLWRPVTSCCFSWSFHLWNDCLCLVLKNNFTCHWTYYLAVDMSEHFTVYWMYVYFWPQLDSNLCYVRSSTIHVLENSFYRSINRFLFFWTWDWEMESLCYKFCFLCCVFLLKIYVLFRLMFRYFFLVIHSRLWVLVFI